MYEIDRLFGLRGNVDWHLFKDTETGQLFHEATGWREKFEDRLCVKCHETKECREIEDKGWHCHSCRGDLIDQGEIE